MSEDAEWPKKKYASEQERKSQKPVLEKKRRQRINRSLEALKSLLLDAVKAEGAHHSKLEKADILEMTVKHLKDLQQNQLNAAVSVDPRVLRRYHTGFSECATEVRRYLATVDGIQPAVKSRLVDHLSNCSNSINNLTTPLPPPGPGGAFHHQPERLSQYLHVPVSATPLYQTQPLFEATPMQISPVASALPIRSQPVHTAVTYAQPVAQRAANLRAPAQQIVTSHTETHTPHRARPSSAQQATMSRTAHSLSPVFMGGSIVVSPITRSPSEPLVSLQNISPPLIHYHRKPEASFSSPSTDYESYGSSTGMTSSSSSEIEKQFSSSGQRLKKTSRDSVCFPNESSVTDSSGDSSVMSSPAIDALKTKSTQLFSHSTPKLRPLSMENNSSLASDLSRTSSEIRSPKNQHVSDTANKENCPQVPLFVNENQIKIENMWRPW